MRRVCISTVGLLLCLFAGVGLRHVYAQDDLNRLTYNGIGVTFPREWAVNISVSLADAPDEASPVPPMPAAVVFQFIPNVPAENNTPPVIREVRLYRAADFGSYPIAAEQLERLRQLLSARADLSPYLQVDLNQPNLTLPYLPGIGATQVMRAKITYLDGPVIGGIRYLTVYAQDVSPFTADRVLATFQGLSADGQYVIAATFGVRPSVFPEQIDPSADSSNVFDPAVYQTYLSESAAQLHNDTDPSLLREIAQLDAVVASINIQ